MKISKEECLEMRALAAEIANARGTMGAAQRTFEDAKVVEATKVKLYSDLHTRLGLHPEKHLIVLVDTAQPDGRVIEAGEVFDAKTQQPYDPAPPAAEPKNRQQRRAAKKSP